jgi:hypothetical protein
MEDIPGMEESRKLHQVPEFRSKIWKSDQHVSTNLQSSSALADMNLHLGQEIKSNKSL